MEHGATEDGDVTTLFHHMLSASPQSLAFVHLIRRAVSPRFQLPNL
jgi:hypothetical protein